MKLLVAYLVSSSLFGTAFCALDAWQQIFGQAWSAYVVDNSTGTQSQLQVQANAWLPGNLTRYGNWTPAFGPVVYKANATSSDFTADNVWFGSFNPTLVYKDGTWPTYVVSIAGTELAPDDIFEDANVDWVVPLNDWAASGQIAHCWTPTQNPIISNPYLSNGTACASSIVSTVTSVLALKQPGVTLVKWLQVIIANANAAKAPIRIIFTGHSLGGGLAISVSFILSQMKLIAPSSYVDIRVYPIAAPSVGNDAYNSIFSSTFKATNANSPPYSSWNLNVAHDQDIVPMAWCALGNGGTCLQGRNLDNMVFMYDAIQNGLAGFTTSFVAGLILLSAPSNLNYGTSPINLVTGIAPNPSPTTSVEWLDAAWNEHVEGYCLLFFGTPTC
ncbi:Alpha/Beta hydrolase protein [Auriculariales sp. MPI-PUGE-AT-0066]|nr:Alpha/Beta hydrolase protein [Auriculariales sp. MPI-PUGE-AT-0066]